MGCVSSKLLKKNLKQELLFGTGDVVVPNHVVSLTSSTYGALKLDPNHSQKLKQQQQQQQQQSPQFVVHPSSSSSTTNTTPKSSKKVENNEEVDLQKKKEKEEDKVGSFGSKRVQNQEELEVINTWELMEGLEEEVQITSHQPKTGSKSSSIRGERSPFKRLIVDQMSSPKEGRNSPLVGKENRGRVDDDDDDDVVVSSNCKKQQCYTTPRSGSMKASKFTSNSTNKLRKTGSMESPRKSSSSKVSSNGGGGGGRRRRRSLGPLFDPELIVSIEKELCLEKEEQIKEMVQTHPKPWKNHCKTSPNLLKGYAQKCPPGGEECVVMYTTTLRGIRKTFEDCNAVRSAVESYRVRVIERDVSMDTGYKEELRNLMGTKEVRVPLVFVKGRLIGGAQEVLKLDEEGKLEGLFHGIAQGLVGACDGCGGIRFVMCMDCYGSCKVLDQSMQNMVRCGECNENGLIHCPICS